MKARTPAPTRTPISITNGQFVAMREAICKTYDRLARNPLTCEHRGHVDCTKAANAALRALRKGGDA